MQVRSMRTPLLRMGMVLLAAVAFAGTVTAAEGVAAETADSHAAASATRRRGPRVRCRTGRPGRPAMT